MVGKIDSTEKTAIQSQENIHNHHLLMDNELDNVSHIQCVEYNFSHVINSEDQVVADAESMDIEIDLIPPSIQNVPGSNKKDHSEVIHKIENAPPDSVSSVISTVSSDLIPSNIENVSNCYEIDHHEENLKFDVIEKRSRGRRVKNKNIRCIPHMSQAYSPLQNKSNKVNKIKNSYDTEVMQLAIKITDPVIDENKSSALHKSERMEMCKLIDETFDNAIQEVNSNIKNAPECHVENQKSEITTPEVTSNVENITECHEIDSCKGNQKEEATPEVKVKRKRGRPRKKQNKGCTLNVSRACSLLQDTSNKVGKIKSSNDRKNRQLNDKTPDLVTNKNKPPAIRKSERMKKKKLAYDETFDNVRNAFKCHEENQKSEIITPGVPFNVENVTKCHGIDWNVGNQKAEATAEVNVKKKRGRPRKIQNEICTLVVSDASSPFQDTSNKVDKIKSTNGRESMHFEDTTPNSVTNKTKSSTIDKSERVKKYKLTNDEIIESSKVKSKPDRVTNPVKRKVHRGRHRKVPSKVSEENISGSKADGVVKKEKNQRGSPKKCVNYANQNLGVESFKGLNNAKNTIEFTKIREKKEKESQTSKHKKGNILNKNNHCEQDETTVLPLKKRKQRQIKKEDFVYGEIFSVDTSEDTSDSESLLNADKNMLNFQKKQQNLKKVFCYRTCLLLKKKLFA